MYLAVDVGGTKTLIAAFDDKGKIANQLRFPTPRIYQDFLEEMADNVAKLSTVDFMAATFGIPGIIDRKTGRGLSFGNLKWRNVNFQADMQKILNCPVIVENDAKLGALSEAVNLKDQYTKVLYITLGTGIGIALVNNRQIDTNIGDGGGKTLLVEHQGSLKPWESFASGKAIKRRFGKRASEIDDPSTWEIIARDIAIGLIDVISLIDPDVVVLGGGVSVHYAKFADFLKRDLKTYEKPMLTIPPLKQAERPEEAVIYGCYELARSKNEKTA